MESSNKEKKQSGSQRKMMYLFDQPQKKYARAFEPYVPPYRRLQQVDQSSANESKSKETKPSTPVIFSNNSVGSGSKHSDSKSMSYKNNDSFDTVSNSHNSTNKDSNSIDNFLDVKKSFKLSCNGTANNKEVEDQTEKIDQVVERLLKLVDTHVNTGLKEILDGLYEQAYGECLPQDILSTWKFCVTLKKEAQTQNLSANTKLLDETQLQEFDDESLEIQKVPGIMNLKSLADTFWINIFGCKNILDIQGHVVDANHLGEVEKLSKKMQSFYGSLNTPYNVIIKGSYYALLDGSWHRVQCLEHSGSSAKIFFIDRGDEDTVSVNQLHVLSTQFCSLPAQAIRLALSGMEVFEDFHELQPILNEILFGKMAFAEVVTVSNDHLSVKLYITDEHEQIKNVHELLLNQMFSKLLDPRVCIQPDTIFQANISYVENFIYLQLDRPSFKYLNILIERAIKDQTFQKQSVIRHEVNQIYFVKSTKNGHWYRGKIINFKNETEFEVFLIDVGSSTTVKREDVISLDRVCNILVNYPAQAIKVQLEHIPVLSPKTQKCLEKLISRNKNFYIKFVTVRDNDNVPTIQLMKKTDSGFLASINDALVLNQEIGSKMDDDILLSPPKHDKYSTENINESPTQFTKSLEKHSKKETSCTAGQLTKSLDNCKIETESETNNLLKIDKNKISKIRKMHMKRESIGQYIKMYLSSVLEAPLVPEDNYFDAHVILASDPSNFVIQLLRNKTLKFNKMVCKMSESCRSYKGPTLTSDSIKVGQLYACKSSEINRDWYRAYVTEIKDNKMAFVYCCDSGSYRNVDISDLVPLGHKFYGLPYQAIWAELNGVKPTSKEWTVRACLKFQELTQSKNFVCRVVSKKNLLQKALEKPSKVPVTVETVYSLELIDTSSTDDILIADLLVAEGVAERSYI